jgi:ankyrin repeat protein
LIDRGADVNLKTEEGSTALHLAIEWDQAELVPVLIENGADTLVLNEEDQTPLMTAIVYDDEAAVNAILDSGKPVGSLKGATPDVISAEFSLETIDKLKTRGLDIQEVDADGYNALQLALYGEASRELIEGLLERGVTYDFKMDDQSIQEFLQEQGREDLLDLFTIKEMQAR